MESAVQGHFNGGFEIDDFFVDQLLDFSNEFSQTEEQSPEKDEPVIKNQNCPEKQTENTLFSPKDDFVSLSETELNIPAEGLESLEWLSHFVEDSFSDYSLTGKLPPKPPVNRSEPVVKVSEQQPCFTTPVQTKARTKRGRTGLRVWPVLSPSFTESSTTSSSSSTSSPTSNLWFETGYPFVGKPPSAKKYRKNSSSGGTTAAQPRRCTHCGVTKTPQWRAGPLGSKTLCNACGVRYKSGRLLPEYRPACSPTFSSELHSNNHRKVLEMRRSKEGECEATPVQSF